MFIFNPKNNEYSLIIDCFFQKIDIGCFSSYGTADIGLKSKTDEYVKIGPMFATAVAIDPTGEFLFSGHMDGSVWGWIKKENITVWGWIKKENIYEGECIFQSRKRMPISSLSVSDDSRTVVIAGRDSKAAVALRHGKIYSLAEGHNQGYLVTTVSGDGDLIVTGGGRDRVVSLWEYSHPEDKYLLKNTFGGHRSGISQVGITKEKKFTVSSSVLDGKVYFWNNCRQEKAKTSDFTFDRSASIDSKMTVYIGHDRFGNIRFINNGKCTNVFVAHKKYFKSVTAMSICFERGILLTGDMNGLVSIWKIDGEYVLTTKRFIEGEISTVVIGNDPNLMYVAYYDSSTFRFRLSDEKIVQKDKLVLSEGLDFVTCITEIDNTSVLFGDNLGGIYLYEFGNSTPCTYIGSHRIGPVKKVRLKNEILVSINVEGELILWDMKHRRKVAKYYFIGHYELEDVSIETGSDRVRMTIYTMENNLLKKYPIWVEGPLVGL
jgi:WD40 repeat protein